MVGSRARVITLLLLTFAAGTAAGVAADRLNLVPRIARAEEGEAGGDHAERRGGFAGQTTIERFADDLGLTTRQRVEIEEILDSYRSSLRGVWSEVRPRYRSLVDSARTRIEAVLTADQVAQYRELLETRRRRGQRGERSEGADDDGGEPPGGESGRGGPDEDR